MAQGARKSSNQTVPDRKSAPRATEGSIAKIVTRKLYAPRMGAVNPRIRRTLDRAISFGRRVAS